MAKPSRPEIVLRVALAGNRKLQAESELRARLKEVFSALETTLLALAQKARTERGARNYYAEAAPAIRLISGLADGADQIGSDAFLSGRSDRVRREISAVFPFGVDTYRDRSAIENKERFGTLLAECRYVFELDGSIGDPAAPHDRVSRAARAAAYRAQSATLLRQADLLIAIENPQAEGKAGGTRETIGRALALGVPVIYVPLGEERIAVLRLIDDVDVIESKREWREDLSSTLRVLLADPRSALPSDRDLSEAEKKELRERQEYEDEVLAEYFSGAEPPPAEFVPGCGRGSRTSSGADRPRRVTTSRSLSARGGRARARSALTMSASIAARSCSPMALRSWRSVSPSARLSP